MSYNVSFFLPTRKGSQRVINKNTRPFSDIQGGLLELKLKQLLLCANLNEIILSTNDEDSIIVAQKIDPQQRRIKIIKRPEELCKDDTPLQELIKYVPTIIQSEHIIWGHVTTPFINSKDYDNGIVHYYENLQNGFDSVVSVTKFQNFLLEPSKSYIYNYNTDNITRRWPRTQDLPLLYEVNHAMFITSKKIYLSKDDRIGDNINFYEMDKIKSFDIDWEDDFLIAEAIYEKIYRS